MLGGDYATAFSLFKPLAEHGDVGTPYNLGLMYGKGQGVAQDYMQAAKWLILAKAGGIENANKLLSSLESRITPTQIAEAQRLANQWWGTHHKP